MNTAFSSYISEFYKMSQRTSLFLQLIRTAREGLKSYQNTVPISKRQIIKYQTPQVYNAAKINSIIAYVYMLTIEPYELFKTN